MGDLVDATLLGETLLLGEARGLGEASLFGQPRLLQATMLLGEASLFGTPGFFFRQKPRLLGEAGLFGEAGFLGGTTRLFGQSRFLRQPGLFGQSRFLRAACLFLREPTSLFGQPCLFRETRLFR
ncbi:hypothetical protein [Archangium violaceum]|uniref:hypothetical protein n=1 Tax=Archangium violaceum TaxID=83451 RepID=UPI000695DBCE|nr:hypothetical protein [Archangium violaceum]